MNQSPDFPGIKIRLYRISLTHCHTIPHFDTQKIYSCRKHCENSLYGVAFHSSGRYGVRDYWVKKSICWVALNKEQFDPLSSPPKNIRLSVHVSVCVQNTTGNVSCQSAGNGIKSHFFFCLKVWFVRE